MLSVNAVCQICITMKILAERLKELRGAQSQREMAEPLGIKWNAWARYEQGKVSPGAEILRQICITHACSADWLLGLDQNINNRDITETRNHSKACRECSYKKKYLKIVKTIESE